MIVKAEPGTYIKAGAPATMYSGALGPCIGVGAIYKTQGFLAHDFSDSLVEVGRLLDDLKGIQSLERLAIYVGGGCLEFDNDPVRSRMCRDANLLTLRLRKQTLQKIASVGFANNVREVLWGTYDYAIELYLYLAQGNHYFKRISPDASPTPELGFLR